MTLNLPFALPHKIFHHLALHVCWPALVGPIQAQIKRPPESKVTIPGISHGWLAQLVNRAVKCNFGEIFPICLHCPDEAVRSHYLPGLIFISQEGVVEHFAASAPIPHTLSFLHIVPLNAGFLRHQLIDLPTLGIHDCPFNPLRWSSSVLCSHGICNWHQLRIAHFQGPIEKPGIFIQSTKAGRLAREVGLRPGDQIIECNGASFRNIEFGDAVFHLKSSRKLELLVRKGAGLELFPSESSGYDSSASSSVGDSPAGSNSSVASEKDRSDQSETGVDVNHNTVVKPPKLPRPPDPPPARVPTPQNTNNHEVERRKLQAEQDRLRREAEALSEERRKFEEEKRLLRSSIGSRSNLVGSKSISNLAELHLPPSPKTHNMPSSPSHTHISKSPSASSTVSGDSSSSSSSSSGGSLAAALQSEIKRRAQKATTSEKESVGRSTDSKSGTDAGRKAPYITDKNEKHDLLIAEFKKAHRKMFSSSPEVSEEEDRLSLPPPAPPKPSEKAATAPSVQKPKAPPPPPKSSVSSISSSSSPSPRPSLSTFKPVVSPRSR